MKSDLKSFGKKISAIHADIKFKRIWLILGEEMKVLTYSTTSVTMRLRIVRQPNMEATGSRVAQSAVLFSFSSLRLTQSKSLILKPRYDYSTR